MSADCNLNSLNNAMKLRLIGIVLFAFSLNLAAQEEQKIKAVQLYSQDELIYMIENNEHLDRVVLDKCQLVRDIEARAEVLKIPAYQFLWGDMLAWGVCIKAEPTRGVHFMKESALQGLPPALEQLGRYYAAGKLVQKDLDQAVIYLREAGSLGNLKAQIQLAELFIKGHGSPYDFEDSYHWLYNAITNDDKTHKKIAWCLDELGKLMHPKAIRRARRPLDT